MILIIYAHPYPQHSHANKRMLEQARTLEGVEVRSLYELYPDFNIDIAAEQEALSRADLIVCSILCSGTAFPPYSNCGWIKCFPTAGPMVTAGRRSAGSGPCGW